MMPLLWPKNCQTWAGIVVEYVAIEDDDMLQKYLCFLVSSQLLITIIHNLFTLLPAIYANPSSCLCLAIEQ